MSRVFMDIMYLPWTKYGREERTKRIESRILELDAEILDAEDKIRPLEKSINRWMDMTVYPECDFEHVKEFLDLSGMAMNRMNMHGHVISRCNKKMDLMKRLHPHALDLRWTKPDTRRSHMLRVVIATILMIFLLWAFIFYLYSHAAIYTFGVSATPVHPAILVP